jgi:hypothetical protein
VQRLKAKQLSERMALAQFVHWPARLAEPNYASIGPV